jgi:hypothetical protein
MASQPVDVKTLSGIVQTCFLNSMDGRYSDQQKGAFLAMGTHLRNDLTRAIGQQFDDASKEFNDARKAITDANAQLQKATNDIQQVANAVMQLGALASALDSLLKVAAAAA